MHQKARKSDLIERMHRDIPDYSKKELTDMYDAFMRAVFSELAEGNEVELRSLFKVHIYKPKRKIIYNPKTDELYLSPGRPKLKVHVSRKITDILYKYEGPFFVDKNKEEVDDTKE